MTNNIKALNNFVNQKNITLFLIIIIIVIIIIITIIIITMMVIIHVIIIDAHRFRTVIRYYIMCSSFQFSLLEQWLTHLSPQTNVYIHNFQLNFLFIYKLKAFIMYHYRIKSEIETRVHVENFLFTVVRLGGCFLKMNSTSRHTK